MRRAPADVWLLCVLLVASATVGREFAQVEVPGTPAFVTDAALVVLAILLVRRYGVRGLREHLVRLPLVPLLVYWFAGAVAIVRGLDAYGFDLTKQDTGLVLYSLFLPLAALVASDSRRFRLVFHVLMWAGALSGALVLIQYIAVASFAVNSPVTPDSGLYPTVFPAWVFARLVLAHPVPRLHMVAALVSLLGVGATGQRAAWLGMLLAFVVIAVVAGSAAERRRRLAIAATTAAGFALLAGGTAALEITTKGTTDDLAVERELAGVADPESGGSESSNVAWRLDFWEWSMARAARAPIAGRGYGEPMSFRWEGRIYDSRLPLASGGIDETGPHNEFVHIAFRMGMFAFAALVVLIAIGFARGVRAARGREIGSDDRAMVLALVGLLASACATVGFNDALKGPYISIYVWVPLALLLVAPSVLIRTSSRRGSRSPASAGTPSA